MVCGMCEQLLFIQMDHNFMNTITALSPQVVQTHKGCSASYVTVCVLKPFIYNMVNSQFFCKAGTS